MASDVRRLRRDVDRIERGIGRRYPSELKQRIAAYVRTRRSEGANWSAIALEIGGPPAQTLARWCAPNDDSAGALVPVDVVQVTPVRAAIIAIVSPTGWRLEGLDVEDAVAVLRALG
jgi:transposase-like protein